MKLFNKKLILQILGIASILLVIIAIILIIRNMELKQDLKAKNNESNIIDADKIENIVKENSPGVVVIKNDEEGIWDKKGETNLELNHELTIYDENDENKTFFQTVRAGSDDQGNIYIHELMSGKIKKFSKKGDYLTTIGRKGSGPWEFLNNVGWIFSERDSMFILDGGSQRLNYFTNKGQYLKSFQLTRPIKVTFTGFVRNNENYFYVSFYDADNDKVIHKYDASGKHIISFGMPVQFKQPMKPENYMIKSSVSHGRLATVKDGIYYTQVNPYEIRKYSFSGKLKMIIFRKNSFMPPIKIEHDSGGDRLYVPVFSSMIGIWDEKVINCVINPGHIQSKFGCVVDVFSLNGNLLTSFYLKDRIRFYSIDQEGRLYGTIRKEEEPEKVVCYKLKNI